MKKFIALVLSLVMALSLCAPAWGAPTEIAAADLQTQIDAADDGATITLNDKVVVSSGEATISAPGKTVTIKTEVEDVFTVSGGTLTLGEGVVVDSTSSVIWVEKGGQVIVDGAEITTTCATMCVVAVWNTGGSFTLESGSIIAYGNAKAASGICAYGENSKVTINNGEVQATSSSAAFACGGAEIIVNDGTLTVTNASASNALIASATYGGTGGTVTVKGGTVQGVKAHEHSASTAVIEAGNITGSVSTANDATMTITGGTFAVDPTPYVAEGYKAFEIVEADGGGYLVAKSCNVTFDANGGKNTLTQAPVPAGQFTLPTEHPFTREGYTFKGWATDKNATKVLGATYNVTGDVTFYAIWEEEECTGDSHVKIVVEYSGDKATKVYCDNCRMTFAFVQGTEEDAVAKFGEGNFVNAENDVWYTLKAVSGGYVPVPPAEVGTVVETETVTGIVDDAVVDAVKESDGTVVSVPEGEGSTAETVIVFNDAEAMNKFTAPNANIETKMVITEMASDTDLPQDVAAVIGDDEFVYLEIEIKLLVNDEHVGNITDVPYAIKVPIPASVLDAFTPVAQGYTRHYYVVHLHDGQVDELKATLSGDELVVYGDGFSPYVVTYKDEATPTNYPHYYWPVGDTTEKEPEVTSPETFDAGIALYVGMSVAAAVGTVTLSKKRED